MTGRDNKDGRRETVLVVAFAFGQVHKDIEKYWQNLLKKKKRAPERNTNYLEFS